MGGADMPIVSILGPGGQGGYIHLTHFGILEGRVDIPIISFLGPGGQGRYVTTTEGVIAGTLLWRTT